MINRIIKSFFSKLFMNYGLIGATGVVIDFFVFALLVKSGLDPILASFISVTLGVTNNFLLNSFLNFKRNNNLLKRFVSFYSIGSIGLAITVTLVYVLHDLMGLSPLLAKIITIPPVVGFQFLANKKITFQESINFSLLFIRLHQPILIMSIVFISMLFVIASVFTVNDTLALGTPSVPNIITVLVGVLLSCALGVVTISKVSYDKLSISRIISASLLLYLIVGLLMIYVIKGNVQYLYDSKIVLDSVTSFSQIAEVDRTYLLMFPHQGSYALYLDIIFSLFGSDGMTLIWLLNLAAIMLIVLAILNICSILFNDKRLTLIASLLLILSTPLILYLPLIYGDILGIGLCLAGLSMFMKDEVDISYKRMVAICALLGLGLLLKNNLLILVVPILLVAILFGSRALRLKYLVIGVSVLVLSQGLLGFIYKSYVLEKYNSMNLSTETLVPNKLKWVAMGLQYGNFYDHPLKDVTSQKPLDLPLIQENRVGAIPGGWNGYVDSEDDRSGTYIKSSIISFIESPLYTIKFFSYKLAYQWTSPSFLQNETFKVIDQDKSPVFAYSWIRESMKGKSSIFQDILQSATYFLCIIGMLKILRTSKQYRMPVLAILAAIISGICFYGIWEVMPRYAIPYYLLMIPFAALGLNSLIKSYEVKFKNHE